MEESYSRTFLKVRFETTLKETEGHKLVGNDSGRGAKKKHKEKLTSVNILEEL